MKTKKKLVCDKITFCGVTTFFVLLASCQNKNDILTTNDTQNVNAESASSSYINESADIAASALSGVSSSLYNASNISGFPITGLSAFDDRLGGCANVTLATTGTNDAPAGMITIEYDSCPDANGVTRTGEMIILYSGKKWTVGSTINVRLSNYYRNNDRIEGNLTLTAQASPDSLHVFFDSVLDSGKVTFADGKLITRTQSLTREWIRSIASVSNNEWITLANSSFNPDEVVRGTTKGGNKYSVTITKQLIEKVACRTDKVFIPVQGTKIITVGNEQYTVDYGNGICNKNIISITLNGMVKQITVTAEGN